MLLTCVVLLLILGIDKNISGIDSIILLIMLCIYMYSNYRSVATKEDKSRSNNQSKVKGNNKRGEWVKIGLFFILGLIMMTRFQT